MHMHHNHYTRLLVMAAVSFVAMYVLMYAMVDTVADVYNNLNQVYMAGLMASPMIVIELMLMTGMYQNKRLNAGLILASSVAGLICFVMIRQQTAISDRQFLRSMIPHHSSAILMCEEGAIEAAKIRDLCARIVASQQAEIAEMRALVRQEILK
jgi:uncharacterized protein (DUF305 family)